MADPDRSEAPKDRPFDTMPLDGPSTGEPAVQYMNGLLARGRPDPAVAASLIRSFAHTGVGHELFTILQNKLGNAYVQQVVAILNQSPIQPSTTPAPTGDHPHKFAVLAGGAEKQGDPQFPDPPGDPGIDNFSQDFLQALPFFVNNGYDTKVLYGDSPNPVAPAQAAGLAEVTKENGGAPDPFSRESLLREMERIANTVQPGDEVMLMIATHGYDKASDEQIQPDWHDPDSGHYAFLLPHGEMHLDELAPYRDRIEKRGARLAVLLLTCEAQYALSFATASGQTTVIGESGMDKGEGDFAVSFLANLKPGMSLDEAFQVGKSMMQSSVDDPHNSSERTHKPSGFIL